MPKHVGLNDPIGQPQPREEVPGDGVTAQGPMAALWCMRIRGRRAVAWPRRRGRIYKRDAPEFVGTGFPPALVFGSQCSTGPYTLGDTGLRQFPGLDWGISSPAATRYTSSNVRRRNSDIRRCRILGFGPEPIDGIRGFCGLLR